MLQRIENGRTPIKSRETGTPPIEGRLGRGRGNLRWTMDELRFGRARRIVRQAGRGNVFNELQKRLPGVPGNSWFVPGFFKKINLVRRFFESLEGSQRSAINQVARELREWARMERKHGR